MEQLNSLGWLVPYLIVILAFYFFLIRPQQKKERDTKNMRNKLAEGDEILTIGGIYGKVVNLKDDMLTIEVGADKIKLKIARWAVGKVIESKQQ